MTLMSPTLLAGLAAIAILGLAGALVRVLRHRELNEGQKWDVAMKIVGACAVFVGVVVGLYQYVDKAGMDARKPFLERQLNYYLDATSAASILVTSNDPKDTDKATAAFWRLYWGPTLVVADEQVSGAMVDLASCLRDRDRDKTMCDQDALKKRALALARACRSSIEGSWGVGLGTGRHQ
jgi:hypothetical protein